MCMINTNRWDLSIQKKGENLIGSLASLSSSLNKFQQELKQGF